MAGDDLSGPAGPPPLVGEAITEKDILSACGGEIPFSGENAKKRLRDGHSGS